MNAQLYFERTRLTLNAWLARRALILGLVSFLALSAAFEIPYTYRWNIGTDSDRQFVSGGIYEPEKENGRAFRWTRHRAAIAMPALISGNWIVHLILNGAQPKGPALVKVSAAPGEPVEIQTEPGWKKYNLPLELPAGDSLLTIESDTFVPQEEIESSNDTRTLGVKLSTITAEPVGSSFRVPPFLPYVIPLTLSIVAIYVSLRRLGFSANTGLIASALVLTSYALSIGFARIWLDGQLVRTVLVAVLVCTVFLFFVLPILARLYQRVGVTTTRSALKGLGLISCCAFSLKLVGIFYPQIQINDLLYHLHRLELVGSGQLFFTQKTREFAGGQTIYPPGLYVFLAPLAAILPDKLALMKLFPVVLQSASGFVVFLLARRNGLSERAALVAMFLYLALPFAFLVFSWGIYANIFAQELFLITLTAWFVLPWRSRPWVSALGFSFLFFISLLAHASMLPMLVIFWGVFLGGVSLFRRGEGKRIGWTVVAISAAVAISFLLYFSFFMDKTLADLAKLESQASATKQTFIVGAGLADPDLGLMPVGVASVQEWLMQGVLYLVRETWVYYRLLPVIAALVGVVAMWRRASMRLLALCLAAGFVTVFVFYLAGLVENLYTRYMLFGLPFIALGAGFALDRFWQVNRWMGNLSVAGILLLIQQSLWFWIERVIS